ncbi:hypothetical protein NDU88_003208 [Pleurodeles waltl]|uniref:Uncharacterized protein n=1 Tax=Pleurodeles waltl TaxID=8319 RepID=A0AAV7UXU7_PLEWA|nr:hypothetical protein NDU88_003208 [Pleurodeles waltl]
MEERNAAKIGTARNPGRRPLTPGSRAKELPRLRRSVASPGTGCGTRGTGRETGGGRYGKGQERRNRKGTARGALGGRENKRATKCGALGSKEDRRERKKEKNRKERYIYI